MNNVRRKKISKLIRELELLNNNYSQERLSKSIDTLEDIKNEEEEAFDNMPEGLQYSSRGMDSEAAIDNLDEALSYLEEACEMDDADEREINIEMAIDCLEYAACKNL